MRIAYVISLITVHNSDQHHNIMKENSAGNMPMIITSETDHAFKDVRENERKQIIISWENMIPGAVCQVCRETD
jgi:prephenate dehydratase